MKIYTISMDSSPFTSFKKQTTNTKKIIIDIWKVSQITSFNISLITKLLDNAKMIIYFYFYSAVLPLNSLNSRI